MKKIKISLFGILAALLFMPNVVSAAEVTVCSSGCDHTSLSDAITAAGAGGTVNLTQAGEYQLPETTISNDVTIKGVSRDAIIVPFGTISDTWITVSAGSTLTLNNLTLNGKGYEATSPFTISKAITSFGSLNVDNVKFTNIKYATGNGIGIYSSGESAAGTVTINNVEMDNIEYAGIYVDKAVNNVTTTITDYTYTGRGTVMTNRQFGIIVVGGRIVTANRVNISKCFGEDSVENASAAIYVHGAQDSTISGIVVVYSDLRNNTASFYLGNVNGESGLAVVGESKLGKTYLRNTSDFDGEGIYFGQFTTAQDILNDMFAVGVDESPTFQVVNFYTDENAVGTEIYDVKLSADAYELGVGESKTIEVLWNASDDADKTLVWSSDDTSIVTVDQNGVITGVKTGSTLVRATTVYGKVLTVAVTVVGNPQTADIPVIVISLMGVLGLSYIVYTLNKKQVKA